MNNNNIFPIVIHSILAFLGGCVREIGNVDKKGFKTYRFVSGAFVSTFCGVVTFFLCMNYDVAPWLTAALTSLAGYIGTPMLDLFSFAVRKKLSPLVGAVDEEDKK